MTESEKQAEVWIMSEARSEWMKQIEGASMQAYPTYQDGSPGAIYAGDTDRVVAHYTTHPTYDASQKRIADLEQTCAKWSGHCADQERALADLHKGLETMAQQLVDANAIISRMSDPPQSDNTPDAPPKRGPVDEVVDALDKRLVGRTDRTRLRGALDKADAPLTGRAAGDEALKRISGLGALQGDRR